MSELQDALDFWNETIGPTESLLPNTTKTIVNAARKVADPDYEAAARAMFHAGAPMINAQWPRAWAKAAVNAALGITEET